MNYDGDVMSDMVATGFGSLGLMTSVLVSPDGKYELRRRMGRLSDITMSISGNPTSTNSIASISPGPAHWQSRGAGQYPEVVVCRTVESVAIKTVENGIMTKDLMLIAEPTVEKFALTEEFIDVVAARLKDRLKV
jgi:isocitrate dehydrogenase